MNIDETKNWLESVCGKAGVIPPNIGADADTFEQKETFLEELRSDTFEKIKDKLKASLLSIDLVAKDKKSKLRKKTKKIPILHNKKEGKKLPGDVMDDEYDSHGDRATDIVAMKTAGGTTLSFKQTPKLDDKGKPIRKNGAIVYEESEAQAKLAEIQGCYDELLALSKKMEAKLDKNGNPLFSPRDIEKELWSPLVREGAIPSNLVPDKYSETAKIFRGGAAIYTKYMEGVEGTEMGGGDGIDTFLGVSKDVLKVGSLIGSQILHYVDIDITEASRSQIASHVYNKVKIDAHASVASREKLRKLGADVDKLYASEEKKSALDITKDRFKAQKETGGESDYDAWLKNEKWDLAWEIDHVDADSDVEALKTKLASVEAGQMTQKFAAHKRHQAIMNCASAVTIGGIDAAQRSRDRKRSRRDVAEGIFGTLGQIAITAVIVRDGQVAPTQDKETNEEEKARRLAISAALQGTKAGARLINKISQLAYPANPTDKTSTHDLLVGALGDFFEMTADGVAAGFTSDKDARVTGAKIKMAGDTAKALTVAADKMLREIKKGNWKKAIEVMLAVGIAAPSAAVAGIIGDVSRKDRDHSEIVSGFGGVGEGGAVAVNPFEEAIGAQGQEGFGKSGEMLVVATQHAVINEANDLIKNMPDGADKTKMAALKASMKRCRKMTEKNEELCKNKDVLAWLNLAEGEELDQEIIKKALSAIQECLDNIEMDGEEQSKEKDEKIIENLDIGKSEKAKLESDIYNLRGMLGDVDDDDPAGEPPDNDAILAKFKEIRDVMLKDERVLAGIRDEISEDEEWLENLKRQADLTRLDNFADEEKREQERVKAIKAIETLTKELKKSERKLKMFDMAMKGGIGIVLAAVPGTALLGKIRALVMDGTRLHKRRTALKSWCVQMEAMRSNYSVYEYAVRGEKEVLTAAVVHDSAEVAADIAGVAAETFRLADQTHVGAAVMTSFEKIGKCLNGLWYEKYSESRIKNGWKAFKLAKNSPEDRRLARDAIRINTTLGKCVLAYGACVDKDSQARRAVMACGLTPAVFEDAHDVCQSVFLFLLEEVPDKEFKTVGSHDDVNWIPCDLEPTVRNFTMIKAKATKLDPAMKDENYRTPKIDEQMKILGDQNARLKERFGAAEALEKLLRSYRPVEVKTSKLHAEMNIVVQELANKVLANVNELRKEVDAEKKKKKNS